MAAWDACCAWMRSPSELLRYSSSRPAMVLNSVERAAISSFPRGSALDSRSPSPKRRTASESAESGFTIREVRANEAMSPNTNAPTVATIMS